MSDKKETLSRGRGPGSIKSRALPTLRCLQGPWRSMRGAVVSCKQDTLRLKLMGIMLVPWEFIKCVLVNAMAMTW